MRTMATIGLVVLLAGCGTVEGLFQRPSGPAAPPARPQSLAEETAAAAEAEVPSVAPVVVTAAPPPNARTPDQFDTSTPEQRTEAAAPAGGSGTRLGATIASLGDPAAPGFWAETPLVTAPRPGRLEYPGNGRTVLVELRPSGGDPGSGTRVSLPALRVLGAPLTALPELVVFGL